MLCITISGMIRYLNKIERLKCNDKNAGKKNVR